jgi:predicted HTH domain antitoxin
MSLSEPISLRLPKETINKLDTLANKEHKDRSTLIRELLDNGIQEKDIQHAVDSYKNGQATSWKAAQTAGISLWKFLEVLREKGVLIQYSEHDLKKDLKALTED